jgi:acetylornithine deacetylase/succinyl-diaminopimelate desuccinylase-like protein
MEKAAQAGAVALLQRLIRFNTVNPPGAEREAQEWLAGLLEEAGFECDLPARDPDRPNLVARLRGRDAGPVLCLLGHVDTVPADPTEWTRDPWCGDVVDGEVWGRGALDMKSQVASEAAACIELARSGWRPTAGELLMVVTADEEAGAGFGAKWLCEERPEAVRCDLVINEGAGDLIEIEGRRFYTICLAEKGNFLFRLRTRGIAGHASLPGMGENALLKMAPLLERIAARQPGFERSPEADLFLEAVLGSPQPEPEAALERVREVEPRLTVLLGAMLGVTLVPTMIRASTKDNVIPSSCEALVACRVPPEKGEDHARERIREVLGDGDYEIEFIERVAGSRSPADTDLMRVVQRWVERMDPGATVVPMTLPGFSDSHWFRQAFGAVAYGFFPQKTSLFDSGPLVHAPDERVAVEDVELAASFYADVARDVLG